MPPSLLIKGKLVSLPGMTPKEVKYLKEQIPLVYIINRLKEKLPEFGAKPATSLNDLIFIIRAKTGSGKSTAMPVEIYRLFNPSVFAIREYDHLYTETSTNLNPVKHELITSLQGTYSGKNILCTQPRVLTTMSIPNELSNHIESPWAKDMVIGKTIGYSTGARKMLCKNCLMYSTLDTLLVRLKTSTDDQICALYRVIILDEVHERSITLDIVIMLLKRLLLNKIGDPDCPFIIFTSATFDVEKYARYLGVNIDTNIIDVEGLTFPITDHYLEVDSDNYIKTIARQIETINDTDNFNENGNDMLVFTPGAGAVKELIKQLTPVLRRIINDPNSSSDKPKRTFMFVDINSGNVNSTKVLPLIELPVSALKMTEDGIPDSNGKIIPYRRIFTGTTVAETGITIKTLAYVLETGYTNIAETYFPYNIRGLVQKPVAKSRVKQRKGRVGRKFPGDVYYAYTEDSYNKMMDIQLPEIIVDGLGKTIVDIFKLGYKLEELDMLDVPSTSSLKNSMTTAVVLGAIDYDTQTLTQLGELFSNCMIMTIEHFRIIRSAFIYELYIPDIVTIIVMNHTWMGSRRTWKIKDILEKSLPVFFNKDLDLFTHITLDLFIQDLYVFTAFKQISLTKSIKETQVWCTGVGLDYSSMLTLIENRNVLLKDISLLGLNPLYGEKNEISKVTIKNYLDIICKIKQCLYDGFVLNTITFDKQKFYYVNRFGQKIKIKGIPDHMKKFCNNIVTNKISLGNVDFDSFQKQLECDNWSILDGYVNLDTTYLNPPL